MSIDQYLLFITITSVFLLSPGPSVMLSINNGVKYGARSASIAVCGNVVAFQILIVLSALGLGAALAASSELFNFLKILGALYLVYLGVKIWFSAARAITSNCSLNSEQPRPFSLFMQAFLVTSSNPKALVYVSALLPQFINIEQALAPQVIALALTSAVVQFIIFMLYAVLASKTRFWFENLKQQQVFNKLSGLTFVGFGIALGLSANRV